MKFLKAVPLLLLTILLNSCLPEGTAPDLEEYYRTRDEGVAFLKANLLREEVSETESGSGLQYEVLVEGEGEKPSAESNVSVFIITEHL